MADPEFEFSDVEDKEDRKKFIERFSSLNVKAAEGEPKWARPQPSTDVPPINDVEPDENAPPSTAADEVPEDAQRPAAKGVVAPSRRQAADLNRRTLAPSAGPRLLPVKGIRLAPLYNECRRIVVRKNENAAAFLVRVFIELSSEVYLEDRKITIPPSLAQRSISEWSDFKVKLSEKISAVIHSLDPTGKSPVFVQARSAIKPDAVGAFSIKNLHSYFHNHHVLPEETTIKASWDGWEAYLRALHSALNEGV